MALDWQSFKKIVALLPVVAMLTACGHDQVGRHTETKAAALGERHARAKALFEARCKTAGKVIKRTVQDVEGIELAKIRQPIPWGGKEYFDPLYPEAAMAGESRGDDYIKQFLMSEFRPAAHPERRGQLGPHLSSNNFGLLPPSRGYRFIEYVEPKSGQRMRCVATWRKDESNWLSGQHRCDPTDNSATRYALDYEDQVDAEDRALWVAGTKLRVIDKMTGEVIAELNRFVWDPGFGASSTGRWPWQHANGYGPDRNCPHTANLPPHGNSRYFVDTVLHPKQGDQ